MAEEYPSKRTGNKAYAEGSERGQHRGHWTDIGEKVGGAFSVTGRDGALAVAGYAVLAGHRRGRYGGKGGRSHCP